MKQSALIVIDMQRFFFAENRDVDQRRLAESCNEIVEISRQAGLPVIHVVTLYRADRADWPRAWQSHEHPWCANLVRGGELAAVVGGIAMRPEDILVEKRRFSSFYNTNLDDVLRNLGCERLYIIGYSGDVCVRFTSVDAYNRGYSVGLIYEGIESFRESKDSSVEYLEWAVDAECLTMDEFRKVVRSS